MTTPQDSPRRRKQKARRTKQLNEWRIKKALAASTGALPSTTASTKASASAAKKAK